ncbi:MAG: Fic family protein, partial [Desulfomonile tiedjei]|nr:Fic family protein [Desulfomonile tiedjei]
WTMPSGLSHEAVWGYLKLGRSVNRKYLPLADKQAKLFSYWITDSMLRALNVIDLWSGGTITTDHPGGLPPKEQYIISSLMEEAIASSQLEGAATTRQVAKEMLRSGRKPANTNEQMILNNWETMQYIRSNREMKLSPEKLMDIHQLVTEKTLDPTEAGRLRTRDDIIVSYNNETVHVPPLAGTLPQRIETLCQFANDNDSEHWIHPVIKGAIIHFQLAYDHPFTDGNGRTARALMYWYLLSRRYLLFEYLAISRYFLRAPGQYARAYLYTETDEGDLDYFLQYNLRAITLAIMDLRLYVNRKQKEISRYNELLRSYRGLNARQKTLIYHAIRHPDAMYTIEQHKNYHGIVYQTARIDLLHLATKGFLKKEKQGKEFVFLPCEGMIEKLRVKEAREAKVLESPMQPRLPDIT